MERIGQWPDMPVLLGVLAGVLLTALVLSVAVLAAPGVRLLVAPAPVERLPPAKSESSSNRPEPQVPPSEGLNWLP